LTIYLINVVLILFYAILNRLIYENKKHIYAGKYGCDNYYELSKKKRQRYLTIVIAIQLFALSAFKASTVGADMQRYSSGFYAIANLPWNKLNSFDWEYGYVLLNKIVSLFFCDFRCLILIVSLIIVFLFSKHIYNESKIQWFSFYLFICMNIFNFTLSGYRQSLAMAITAYSIRYLQYGNRNFIKFAFFVLLASLFHQSALIFLLIYPISKMKISKEYILLVSLSGILAYVLGGRFINILLDMYNRKQIVVTGQGFEMFLMLLLITLGGLLFKKHSIEKDDNINLYLHMMILSVFLQIFSFHLSIFVRIVSYFSIHMIIFIPNIISTISSKQLKYASIVMTCLLAFGFYLYNLSNNLLGTIPYRFIWDMLATF
jgi:hypothetical protein